MLNYFNKSAHTFIDNLLISNSIPLQLINIGSSFVNDNLVDINLIIVSPIFLSLPLLSVPINNLFNLVLLHCLIFFIKKLAINSNKTSCDSAAFANIIASPANPISSCICPNDNFNNFHCSFVIKYTLDIIPNVASNTNSCIAR